MYVLAPYERVRDGSPFPRRRCVLAGALPAQSGGGPEPFIETEVLGGYAVALILDDNNLSRASSTPGVFGFPRISLTSTLSDLSVSARNELRDIATSMGYTAEEIRRALGTDLASVTMRRLLSLLASRRRRPRFDADSDAIVLDGSDDPVKPLPIPPMAGGAFPTAGIIDDFNRADESPAVGFTTNPSGLYSTSNVRVVSNQLANISGDAYVYYSGGGPYGPDCEAYITHAVQDGVLELWVRGLPLGASLDGYQLKRSAADTFQFYRVDNAVNTQLGSDVAQNLDDGDSWGIEAIGANLSAYYKASGGAWDASAFATRSDGTYVQTGYIVFYIQTDVNRIDDLGGGTRIGYPVRRAHLVAG